MPRPITGRPPGRPRSKPRDLSLVPAAQPTTIGDVDMSRRNLNPVVKKPMPVDSLGRLRVYFDIDRTLVTALTMLAAKHQRTRRDYVEDLIHNALREDPNIAAALGLA